MESEILEKDVQEVKKQTVPELQLQSIIVYVESIRTSLSFSPPRERVICRKCPKSMWTIESGIEEGVEKLECYCKVQFTNKWSSADPRPNEVSFCDEPYKIE